MYCPKGASAHTWAPMVVIGGAGYRVINNKPTMNKYKVEITRTDSYIVDVLAKNEKRARQLALDKFQKIEGTNTEHYYHEEGDLSSGLVFDVTNTDDPFNP